MTEWCPGGAASAPRAPLLLRGPHDQLHHPPPPAHHPDGVPGAVVPLLPVLHAAGRPGPPDRRWSRSHHRHRRDRSRQRALRPRRPDHHRDPHRHLGRVAVGNTPVLDRRSRHDDPHGRGVGDTRVRARLRAPMALRRPTQQMGLARVGAPPHPGNRARLVDVVLHPDRRAVALPDIARNHPRIRLHRARGAHDAWLDARGSARRLHAHRPGQGADRTKRRPQARPPQRHVAGRDAHRDRLRHGHRRCGAHRDDLLVAGPRIGDRQLRHAARPTGRARAHPGGRDRVRLDQPAGRRLLRLVRPAHPTRKGRPDMTIVEPGVPATVTGVPAPAGAEDLGEARPLRVDVWKRFKRNRLAMVGLVFIVAIVLVALVAPLIAPYGITERAWGEFRDGPSADDWFGTDAIGRDVFSRIVYGARVSLRIGFAATAISLIIGLLLGAVAGFFGGWSDTAISRLIDVFLAIPYIVLAVAIASVLGRTENAIILVLGLTGWLAVARIVRASFLSLKRLEYVEAATALGFSRRRIMYRHILPNALQPIIVIGTIAVGYVILAEAALSFLSVGPQPPTPAWGLMVADGKGALTSSPHLLFFPGAAIFLTVLAFVFVGDGLRDALDPKLK